MIPLKLETLQEHLKQEKYDFQYQKENQQLYLIFNVEGRDFPIFIKTDGSVLQILAFLPARIPSSALPDVARLLHMLNKEMDLPGFGMDDSAGVSFYRIAIPTTDGQIQTELLNNLMLSIPRVAALFFPIVTTVASGVKFEKVVDKVREALKKFAL